MATRIINVSELKTKLASLLTQLDVEGVPVYVTQHGKPKAVLVKYADYETLLERLDDLEDILAMKDTLSSPDDEAVRLEKYERQRATHVQR